MSEVARNQPVVPAAAPAAATAADVVATLTGFRRAGALLDRWRNPDANALATLATGVLAFVKVYFWGIGGGLWGQQLYAAAARSASVSWRAMFFGSLDPGGFITVDKPPLSTAVMGMSGRIFGFNPTSMALPQAVFGVASVLLACCTGWSASGRRPGGAPGRDIGLAVTPVAALMFRYNNPDALLTLLCIAAALAMWVAIETGRTRWILLSSALIGLGFDTKMLQVALVVPALFAAYAMVGPEKLGRRLEQLCAGVWSPALPRRAGGSGL